MNLSEQLQQKKAFCSLRPASNQQISEAENALGVKFAQEYKEYAAQFGAACYFGHELTGVCQSPALSVVTVTLQEREYAGNIPTNWYVLERANIDGIVFWQDEKGVIYKKTADRPGTVFCQSLTEYIKKS